MDLLNKSTKKAKKKEILKNRNAVRIVFFLFCFIKCIKTSGPKTTLLIDSKMEFLGKIN